MKKKILVLLLTLPLFTAISAGSYIPLEYTNSEVYSNALTESHLQSYSKRNVEESARLIREDRIWTYEDLVYGREPGEMGKFNLKFDGTSVFEKKEYHNVYIWRPEKEYSKENAILIGYMREEGDRVYVYNDWDGLFNTLWEHDLKDNDDFKFLLYGPTTHRDKYGTSEYLIYDFSLTPEDPNPVNTPFMLLEDDWTVTYDDKEYNYQYFISDRFPLQSLGVYEKIGAGYGFLPYPGTGSDNFTSMKVDYWNLCTVSDLDGNILFNVKGVTTGIDRIDADDAIVISERFYNLQGQPVDADTQGTVICVKVMSDGNIHTVKKFIR